MLCLGVVRSEAVCTSRGTWEAGAACEFEASLDSIMYIEFQDKLSHTMRLKNKQTQ